MPSWLWKAIVGIASTIAAVAVIQWWACRFYVLPQVWPWYAKWHGTSQGQMIEIQPMGCNDVDNRTITVMMGVLTTLISLSRNAE